MNKYQNCFFFVFCTSFLCCSYCIFIRFHLCEAKGLKLAWSLRASNFARGQPDVRICQKRWDETELQKDQNNAFWRRTCVGMSGLASKKPHPLWISSASPGPKDPIGHALQAPSLWCPTPDLESGGNSKVKTWTTWNIRCRQSWGRVKHRRRCSTKAHWSWIQQNCCSFLFFGGSTCFWHQDVLTFLTFARRKDGASEAFFSFSFG